MARPYKCKYCESTQTIWKGYRQRTTDKARIRQCRECKRRWTTHKIDPINAGPAAGEQRTALPAPEYHPQLP